MVPDVATRERMLDVLIRVMEIVGMTHSPSEHERNILCEAVGYGDPTLWVRHPQTVQEFIDSKTFEIKAKHFYYKAIVEVGMLRCKIIEWEAKELAELFEIPTITRYDMHVIPRLLKLNSIASQIHHQKK